MNLRNVTDYNLEELMHGLTWCGKGLDRVNNTRIKSKDAISAYYKLASAQLCLEKTTSTLLSYSCQRIHEWMI